MYRCVGVNIVDRNRYVVIRERCELKENVVTRIEKDSHLGRTNDKITHEFIERMCVEVLEKIFHDEG